MLFGIITIIIFFGLVILIFWYSIKREEKESQELLDDEIKNHYFIKMILDITDIIKNLDEINKIKFFLQKENEERKSFHALMHDIKTMSELGILLGVFGTLLTRREQQKSIIVNQIEDIQGLWSACLFYKVKESNLSKKEKNEINKDVLKKINYLLNTNVLLATNRSDIKEAWTLILEDKVLTKKTLNQLWGQVRKTLFPGYHK